MTTFRIAVIGGTGPQGKGLAYRWARHGHEVVIGSRSAEKAVATAHEVGDRVGAEGGAPVVSGATNAEAAAGAEVVVLAVPYDGHDELVASLAEDLAGKTVISCVNPLGFDKRGPYGLDVERSAAEAAAELAPDATVVGAFHHVSAVSLWSKAEYLDHEDVLVCGDSAEGKEVAQELARSVTSRIGIDAGMLRLARQLEPLTAVLISINKAYKVRSGIRISGI
ncbi:MAG: NADPH-dependent F420 reductase [Nocardioides sp.]